MSIAQDEKYMRQALTLAARGLGLTSPNPAVGALVIKNGRVVGKGYHRRAGGPHAEVVALKQAGARAKKATLYVTLEPCSTHGRTPPCVEAIIKAGIREVVVGCSDPNPNHKGRGLRYLKREGITVRSGVFEAECRELIRGFSTWVTEKRPFVTLKLAMSLDGTIADEHGRSRWITGKHARERVQNLRREVDAVMVGADTARVDDPSLMPRPMRNRSPRRVIVSSNGRGLEGLRVLNDQYAERTLVALSSSSPRKRINAIEKHGAQVLPVRGSKNGISIPALMRALGKKGITHVLCEGGANLAAVLLKHDVVDELVIFTAPIVLGDKGISGFAGKSWKLGLHPQFEMISSEQVGPDHCVRLVRKR